MLGLIERVERAERIQEGWNHGLTKEQREKLIDENESFVKGLFRKAGETQCTECLCIQETSLSFVACNECSGNTVSPYYC
jgi:hypothetical protein